VCFHRFGRLRDRTFESQRHRASGLNLVVAAIILWNTVYLSRAITALRDCRRRSPGRATAPSRTRKVQMQPAVLVRRQAAPLLR